MIRPILQALACLSVMATPTLDASTDIVASACIASQQTKFVKSHQPLAAQATIIRSLLQRSIKPGGKVSSLVYNRLLELISAYLSAQNRPYQIEGRKLFLLPHSQSQLGLKAKMFAEAKLPTRLGFDLEAYLTEDFIGYFREESFDIFVSPMTIIGDVFSQDFEHEFSHWLTDYQFLVDGQASADQLYLEFDSDSLRFSYLQGSSVSEYGAMLAELILIQNNLLQLDSLTLVGDQKLTRIKAILVLLENLRINIGQVFTGHFEILEKFDEVKTQLDWRIISTIRHHSNPIPARGLPGFVTEKLTFTANGVRLTLPVAVNFYRWTSYRPDIYNPFTRSPRLDPAYAYFRNLTDTMNTALKVYYAAWLTLPKIDPEHVDHSLLQQLRSVVSNITTAHQAFLANVGRTQFVKRNNF